MIFAFDPPKENDALSFLADFWTTRCERCPEALAKLNDFASEYDKPDEVRAPQLFYVYLKSTTCGILFLIAPMHSKVLFLSVCLDDEDFGKELVEEWEYTNVRHVFMGLKEKEAAKATLGFAAVPFYVVTAAGGRLVASGGPKAMTLAAIEAALASEPPKAETVAPGAASAPIDVESPNKPEPAEVQPALFTDEDF